MSLTGIRQYPAIAGNVGATQFPLTFQQERALYFCELDPNSSIWDINTCKRLSGSVDANLMKKAVELLIDTHQILRTRIFRGVDGPVQSFDQDTSKAFRHIDISQEAVSGIEEALSALLTEICQKPISGWTYDELLFEVVLLTLANNDHVLLFRVHHIISDAASVDLLWRDLTLIYNDLIRGSDGELPAKGLKYSDYAIWQRRHFGPEQTREQEEYWLSRFPDEVPALDFPTDAAPSPELSFKGGLAIVDIPADLIQKFYRLSCEKRVLLFSSLFSAYFVLLQKFCQQEDITVGVLFSGRHYCPELNETAGFFVNMTAVREHVAWDHSFQQLVEKVHEQVETAYYMQDYPFERLVQKLGPSRRDGRVPLVRTMFNLVANVEDENLFNGVERQTLIDVATQTNAVQVDLIFDLHWSARSAEIRIEHNTDIFQTETVVRLANHYITLLSQLCSDWNVGLNELELVNEKEKRQLIEDFNPAKTSYASDKCVHELFEAQAGARPAAIALVDGDVKLTYQQTNETANRLANFLREKGVVPDSIVAIIGGRSAEMVLGQLAILKAGGAYLPIARSSPRNRIHELLRDAQPRVLILPDDYREPLEFDGPVVRLSDANRSEAGGQNLTNQTSPANLAYVIYTSGSTGMPKGVMVEHRSVVNLATNVDYLEFRTDDALVQTGAPGFDATTFEVWGALLNGLRLYMVSDEVLLDANALAEFLARNRITIMFLVPPLFNQLVDANESLFKPLRYVITGGDVISMKHVERARQASSSLAVINAYGPTENTTYSTCYPITQTEPRTIPIGRPIPNSKAYIFDREMKLSPLGAIGELYVGGDGLARGYLNRPSLTEERFIMNPLVPGERIYKTGDLVRRRPDGAIEFIGRVDRQVKIRGFRIELGEIENRLLEHAGVKEAAVTSATDTNGNKYLCAYYVSEPKVTAAELRDHLAALLPSYMVPSHFCELEVMPLTESGKIDQRALPAPQPDAEAESVHMPLRNPTELKVAHIWEELLETTNIGALDNFFEIGGHSLKASALASRLSTEFGVPVSLRMVFDSPTVSELAALICNGDGREYRNAVGR